MIGFPEIRPPPGAARPSPLPSPRRRRRGEGKRTAGHAVQVRTGGYGGRTDWEAVRPRPEAPHAASPRSCHNLVMRASLILAVALLGCGGGGSSGRRHVIEI